jgi:hypothetical protein
MFTLIMILDNFNQAFALNSFPKIFGGSGNGTFINQIDVFADYLTMAGRTFDTTLATGLTVGIGYPFVVMTSVAIPE